MSVGRASFKKRIASLHWTLLAVLVAGCSLLVSDKDNPGGPATAEALHGTTWRFDDFSATFDAPDVLTLHDFGSNAALPERLPGTFTVQDEFIEVNVLDKTRAGVWDGSRLVIDGMVGVREQGRRSDT